MNKDLNKKCKDCGVEISEYANHTGCEQWCEDCFDIGLTKDMNQHFTNFLNQEMALLTETTSNE